MGLCVGVKIKRDQKSHFAPVLTKLNSFGKKLTYFQRNKLQEEEQEMINAVKLIEFLLSDSKLSDQMFSKKKNFKNLDKMSIGCKPIGTDHFECNFQIDHQNFVITLKGIERMISKIQ
ncbi:unnamed protein product [Brachionus calyciflorus]|uniref:Uncharacterized protein n=1 Tax=Brachionus calyciflorus TaxID=104777 RepID=A0A813MGB9_9BILA|nr:unnamed protein product [Brachionus calyciflorus]